MNMSREQEIEKLAELIKDIDFAMMTTTDGKQLRCRPMSTQKAPFDGTLWFFTEIDSPKVDEIRANPNIGLGYVDKDKNNYVSVSGHASVFQDVQKQRELWSPHVKAWFDGPEDPKLAIIKVDVEEAEYWDGPGNKLVLGFKLLKSAVTGDYSDMGENDKITLR